GSQSSELNNPFSFSFDHSGNMFVTDQSNHRIQKFQYVEESCMNTSSLVQTVYASELATSSSTYFDVEYGPSSYYDAMQMNVRTSGFYTFIGKSNMNIIGRIYKDDFNPSNPAENELPPNANLCNKNQFRLTDGLEASITYILIVTTFSSNVTGTFSIFISGPDNVHLKNISYPSAIETTFSGTVQSKYILQLTTNSQTYSRECGISDYYYQTIRVNVEKTEDYTLIIFSEMTDLYGYIYKNDFNPMDPFENRLSKDYRASSDQGYKLIANLHTGITYILVVTTRYPNETGNFSIKAAGRNNITLNSYIGIKWIVPVQPDG
ncbi:unnamed protein product, partial [Adineta steineri]